MHRYQSRSSPRSSSEKGLIRSRSMLNAFSKTAFRCFLTSDCIASSRLSALSFSLKRSSVSAVFFETLIVVVSFNADPPTKYTVMQIHKYTCIQAFWQLHFKQPLPEDYTARKTKRAYLRIMLTNFSGLNTSKSLYACPVPMNSIGFCVT